jgi:RNA polymerase sigma factor (sigma-70 family)
VDSSQKFWEKIYLENAPKLIGVCRRYVYDPELAEDLVHDAFLTAIDKQSTYTGKGNFEGWLRQIVVNTALMYLRKEKNHNVSRMPEMTEKTDFDDMPEEETHKSIIEEAQFSDSDLLAAIDSLPIHHKLVFNLYVIEDYSHKQIAQKLNISEGTSKSHLARARKKILEILYEKASSQKKDKTRAAVLLPVFAKANYIDSLFRSRMQDFSLSPAKDAALFLSKVNWNTQAKPHILKKQIRHIGMQVTNFVVFPAVLMVVAIYTTLIYIHSKAKPDVTNQQEYRSQPAPKPVADSIHISAASAKADSISHIKQVSPTKTIKKTPVVVKRTIVQKQTIKVQKSIQVYDTTGIR